MTQAFILGMAFAIFVAFHIGRGFGRAEARAHSLRTISLRFYVAALDRRLDYLRAKNIYTDIHVGMLFVTLAVRDTLQELLESEDLVTFEKHEWPAEPEESR